MEKNADNRGLLVLADKSITRLNDFKLRLEKSGLELWVHIFAARHRENKEFFLSILLGAWMHFSSMGIFKFKFFQLFKKIMFKINKKDTVLPPPSTRTSVHNDLSWVYHM